MIVLDQDLIKKKKKLVERRNRCGILGECLTRPIKSGNDVGATAISCLLETCQVLAH